MGWHWHITKTLVIPPLPPGSEPPVIIRFTWWKRLTLLLLVLWLVYSVAVGSWITVALLVLLPARLHRLIVWINAHGKK